LLFSGSASDRAIQALFHFPWEASFSALTITALSCSGASPNRVSKEGSEPRGRASARFDASGGTCGCSTVSTGLWLCSTVPPEFGTCSVVWLVCAKTDAPDKSKARDKKSPRAGVAFLKTMRIKTPLFFPSYTKSVEEEN